VNGCRNGKIAHSFEISEPDAKLITKLGLNLIDFNGLTLEDFLNKLSPIIYTLLEQGTLRNDNIPNYIDILVNINNAIIRGLNNGELQSKFICYSYFE